ncbi:hypothetical protein METBIDRAFT_75932 [Metschnikowia bicuspidata var. bicuspidata NRRL YB-4993]|uniref:DUF3533 domain-containing protein n=1 Tax=Metschnikowia bicuspidata var. bicuspidata NRRL YB-4993 TaxID=869754 RepID=A0A1A0HFW6_9ASCO|nr:hypothetical protein METBIDRAFT_75932 [Metschnikowia bicuspidata var. bicuspidata NRRL YB-4993]OBA22748.1 hypothetical protein METBIDRAFT_75932 [Metschnikowia bicuspidata var. bicuspidata NRRL YB-4993]
MTDKSDSGSSINEGADAQLARAFEGHTNISPGGDAARSQSALQRVRSGFSFFNEKLSAQRKSLVIKTLLIYALMGACILGIFSIYWGSAYQRTSRFKNLRMLVVIEDDQTIDGTDPYIGDYLRQTLQTPEARELGNWLIQNNTAFQELALKNGHDIYAEVQRQVHHQRYWALIYVKPNATINLKNAIINGDTLYNVSYDSVVSFYETGRDMSAMILYVIPNLQTVGIMFGQQQANIMELILANVNTSEVFSSMDSVKVATSSLEFTYVDARPVTDEVLIAPLQVGLIYMIIVTFFGFNFFAEIHKGMIQAGVKKWHLVSYRVAASVSSFFFISLFFSLVTLAFQVDFTVAFGKSGFLVYWMTTFITMCAVGSMNEMVGMLCVMTYPPLLGFWLLFWVISNIAATFSPIALCPDFYRYTYAMPIHAAYEINKVIFFDTYKGAIGRNFGILVAWACIAITGMALVFFPFKNTLRKRAIAERRALEEQILASRAKDEEDRIRFD